MDSTEIIEPSKSAEKPSKMTNTKAAMYLGGTNTLMGMALFPVMPVFGFPAVLGSVSTWLLAGASFQSIAQSMPFEDPKTRAGVAGGLVSLSTGAVTGGVSMGLMRSALGGGNFFGAFFYGLGMGAIFTSPVYFTTGYIIGRTWLLELAERKNSPENVVPSDADM